MTPTTAPTTTRIRAYFAPVNRTTSAPAPFDATQLSTFNLDTPPAPWISVGPIAKFVRKSGTKYQPLLAGAPAAPVAQVRTELDATVSFEFDAWGKLQFALASGSQQSNLLAPTPAFAIDPTGTTATTLNVGATAAATFAPGDILAVDTDYTGQTGYIGAGIPSACARTGAQIADADYIRRCTLNVAVVESIADGVLRLAAPLPAGTPSADMKLSRILGFCDREGASFFAEFSALFLAEGTQGDRIAWYYPRLQPMQSSSESADELAPPLSRIRLAAAFRALPIRDAADGETVIATRTYIPAPMRTV